MLRLFALCLLAWATHANLAAAQQTGLAARGQEIAQGNCARCHAIGPTGESPRPEAPPFRSLSQNFPVTDLEEALVEGISGGDPIMPEFQLSPDDAHALVTYLQSIQDHDAGQARTGHPSRRLHELPQ